MLSGERAADQSDAESAKCPPRGTNEPPAAAETSTARAAIPADPFRQPTRRSCLRPTAVLDSPAQMPIRSHAVMRLICAIFAALSVLSGCASGLTAEQRAWLNEGTRAYHEGQYRSAVTRLSHFLEQVPDRPETAQALYIRGLAYARQGRRSDAYRDLHACVRRTDAGEVAWKAYVTLGVLYFEDGRWPQARESFHAAVSRMPPTVPADRRAYVLYQLGICYERCGQWSEAWQTFARIVRELPDAPQAKDARRRARLRADHYAIQCGSFSQRSNAENLIRRLELHRLRAYIREDPRPRGTRYLVLVGHYSTYEQARAALPRIQDLVPEAFVWP